MTINKQQNGDALLITVKGRLDSVTAPQLQAALIPEFGNVKLVRLDFCGLEYVSSAGLRVLLHGQKTAKTKGSSMVLKNVSPEILEIFEMTGFSDFLKVE